MTEELAGGHDGNRQQELQLKAELNYYKDLWENSTEMHVNVEPDGNIKNCNKALCKRLGYKKGEIVGKSIFFVYHEDSLDDAKAWFDVFIETGIIKDVEMFLKTKDGKKVPVLLNVSAKRDKKGNILYSRSTWQDITERKQAEERFRTVFEHAGDALFVIGEPNGHFVDVNHRACEVLGYTRKELLALCVPDISPVFSTKKFSEQFKALALHEPKTIETIHQRKDGSTFLVEIRGVRININGKKKLLSVARDITERKTAEKVMKHWEVISQNIQMGIAASKGKSLEIGMVNPALCRMTGYSEQELLNMSLPELYAEDDKSKTAEYAKQAHEKGHIVFESVFNRKDGTTFPVNVNLNVVKDDKNNILYRIGMSEDITDRKNAEEEIKKLNLTLEQRIKKRTEDLEKANKELRDFAYVTAHDLKAPLTNLSALIDMIDSDAIADKEGKEIFGKLKNSIGQLHKTVFTLNDIIAFKTTLKDKKERVNFEELFSEIKESIAKQLEAAQATIKHDFSQCPEIDYPPLHLRSIMQNLLTNALKFKHPKKALEIEVKTTEINKKACLIVKDNGLGFDARKYGSKLTGLFTRLHAHVEGKGVGMYIVKSIIDSHGGKIEVESKPNKGALFKIYLNDGKNDKSVADRR